MKRLQYYLLIIPYFAFMCVGQGCNHEKNELQHDHAHEHGDHHGHDDHDEHDHDDHGHCDHEGHGHDDHEGHNHGTGKEINLAPELAEKMGVKTAVVEPGSFYDALRVSGRVESSSQSSGTVSAPTAGILTVMNNIAVGTQVAKGQTIARINSAAVSGGNVNAAAKARLDAAKAELDRLKPLFEKQLVTADKYNAALAEYNAAKAEYSPQAESGAVKSPVAGVISSIDASTGSFVETGAKIASVSDGASLTVTADVPDRYSRMIPDFTDARISCQGTDETVRISEAGGARISAAKAVSTKPGYIPVTFSVKNTRGLIPGSYVEVYLLGKEKQNVVSVPVSALTEQQGSYFVFVKVDDDGYLKSPVTIGGRDGKMAEILSGLHAGDEVVVEGVTAVKLAETSGVVPEGHTHSH